MGRTFGPAIIHEEDGTLRASCSWCQFRIHVACTYGRNQRTIPDPSNTPEWCEMRESMIRDVVEEIGKKNKGSA